MYILSSGVTTVNKLAQKLDFTPHALPDAASDFQDPNSDRQCTFI